MSFIEDFKQRGYFYQCTNEEQLSSAMAKGPIAAYIGFDCTAKSLHVGNLMQVMILRLLQNHGHKPIILIGGGTTKVGDPSGKEELRQYLTDDQIEENISGIRGSLEKFIKFGDGPSDAIMLNNDEWLGSLGYIDFLRQYGRHFSVNRMLTMDSVRMRLEREQSLTFLEFNYMLLQAYDFLHLHQHHNCSLQLGGSDQWGNIVTGVDLTRKITSSEVFGLTTPLLTTSSGAKMGKSVSGAIWLNEDMLLPYDYFQYWRNCEDADVVRFAKLYTECSAEEIDEFTNLAESNINEAKKWLAFKLTEICHGKGRAEEALKSATEVFEKGGIDKNLPTVSILLEELEKGIEATELFVKAGLAKSKGEAKRLIRGRGARVNDLQVEDENLIIDVSYIIEDNYIKLSSGKKKHILISF